MIGAGRVTRPWGQISSRDGDDTSPLRHVRDIESIRDHITSVIVINLCRASRDGERTISQADRRQNLCERTFEEPVIQSNQDKIIQDTSRGPSIHDHSSH